MVITHVIGQDPREPGTLFRISVGEGAGVVSGDAVVSPEGVLVGAIEDVGPAVSTVRLLRSPRTKIPVRIVSKPHAFGLLESPDGLSITVEQIPKSEAVAVGDVVVTDLGVSGIPPNLTVGTVLATVPNAEGLWQEATVGSLVEPSTLDLVAVIRPL